MSNISLSVLTYNTHLFGDLAVYKIIQPFKHILYKDDDRSDQLKDYLNQAARPADLIALQEIWSGAYANNIKHLKGPNYPSFYARNPHHGEFNRSGLCLLAAQGTAFLDQGHYNFISNCNIDGFNVQDYPAGKIPIIPPPYKKEITSKGYVCVTCQLTNQFNGSIPQSQPIKIGVFNTHMITNAGTHHKSAKCCFETIRNAINSFASQNRSAAILLMGDLNVAWEKDPTTDDEYSQYVVDVLKNECGLIDAYVELEKNTPGYTINGNTNLLWQHFNSFNSSPCSPPNCPEERIDYVFYKSSLDSTVQLSPTKAEIVSGNNLLKVTKDGYLDVSDHYPLFVEFQLSFRS
jgi:exonuclease III